ncbi:hypothetical protein [Brevibacillus brevis]|uniref:Uncharacterized protein n=1 Tax=Brevibacillus brevis TaxID=1393 RepID=A0ABY9T9T1_BREBE|nr:hypothetical protein [Brevibacillus brevis]WNC15951.1 hypothetical protein RGB73_06440 [Brevibacillus brevis]
MKKKIADSLLHSSQSKPEQANLTSEEEVREELMNQVLQSTMMTEVNVAKQKDRYMLEGK